MIVFLISCLKIIFLLGFLILIHEGGHFLIAKLCKVKVNEFAIGFGPTLLKWKKKETKYALRLIPLGGFVNMEGEEARSENEGSFSKTSIPKRIAIVAAGGIVNIVFGLIVYFIIISMSGTHISTTIDSTVENYGASIAGLQAGDKVEKINEKKMHTKNDITNALEENTGEEITISIYRNAEQQTYQVKPTEVKNRSTGIYLSGKAKQGKETEIIKIDENSSAQKAGLKVGDHILKINEAEVKSQEEIVKQINEKGSGTMLFTIQRAQEEQTIQVTPDYISTYYLGVNFKQAENNFGNNIYYGFWETKDFALSIIDNLKMLFTGGVSVDQLMGPVGISSVVAQTQGIQEFLILLALISLSLGVTNLLPFPPLDGGKIVILLIEWIRRKPLKENIEVGIQMIGFMLLIGLSILIAYQDVLRIF